MAEKNKRIVMRDSAGKILAVFGSVEEASAQTGIKPIWISKCLNGTWSYAGRPARYFAYEVTAGELRQAAQRKRREKEKEKLEKEGWFK